MSQAPAGWYPQPDGTQRYWDGSAWTDHIAGEPTEAPEPVVFASSASAPAPASSHAAPAAAYSPPAAVGETAGSSRKVVGVVLGVVGGLVLLGIIAIVVFVVFLSKAVSGPNEAAEKMFQAWKDKDCVAEYQVIDPEGMSQADFCNSVDYRWTEDLGDWRISIVSTNIQNDEAVIVTKESYLYTGDTSRTEESWEYYFRKTDRGWVNYGGSFIE